MSKHPQAVDMGGLCFFSCIIIALLLMLVQLAGHYYIVAQNKKVQCERCHK